MKNSVLVNATVCVTLAALLSTSVSHSSSFANTGLITIDRQAVSEMPPLLKSKLGLARATGYSELPATIPYARQLGSRVFCATISFDHLTEGARGNFALGRTVFSSEGVRVDPAATRWLQSLVQILSHNQQELYLGLVGAPKPYQQALIRKPAAHPTPTSISGAAKLTAAWARAVLPESPAINWVIWNEPEHTLRGVNNSTAAGEMASIYRAYEAALSGRSLGEGFGLASFMKASLRDASDDPSRSFASIVLADLAQPPRPAINYITLNSYHGQTFELIARLQADLQRAGMDQPLVINQFAPPIIGSHPAMAGSVQSASHYLHTLDRLIQTPDLGAACMSFWAGPDRKALLREIPGGGFAPSLPFQALALFQQMPLWRVPVTADTTHPTYTVLAARDATRLQVFVVPRPVEIANGLPPGVKGKEQRKNERQQERRRERQQRRRGQRQVLGAAASAPPAENLLSMLFKDSPNQPIQVQRLRQGMTSPLLEQLRTDASGRLNLTMTPEQIVLLSMGTPASLPPQLPMMRSDLYIHREAPQLGWASVDAIRDGFVLALPSERAVAHASATYAARTIGSDLVLQFISPQGTAGLNSALRCSAIVLQGVKDNQSLVLASWGNPAVATRIRRSRAFARSSGDQIPSITVPWPASDAQGRLRLGVPGQGNPKALRLHLGSEGCEAGTQLQARLLR